MIRKRGDNAALPRFVRPQLYQLPQRHLKRALGQAGGRVALPAGAGQRCLDDARYILENGLVGDFGPGFHQMSEYAGYVAVGNEVGNNGAVRVSPLAGGPEEDDWVGKRYVGPARNNLQAAGYQGFYLCLCHEPRGGGGHENLGLSRPDSPVHFCKRQQIGRVQRVAGTAQKQGPNFFRRQAHGPQQASGPVDDAHDQGPLAGQVVGRRRAHVASVLVNDAFTDHRCTGPQGVVVAHGLGHAVAGDEACYGVFAGQVGQVCRVFEHLGDALAQLAQLLDFLGRGGGCSPRPPAGAKGHGLW